MKRMPYKTVFILSLFFPAVFSLTGYAHAQQVDTTRDRDCAKCHKDIAAKKVVHPAIQMGCESCHSEPHQKNPKFPKGLSSAVPDLCYGCHDKTKFESKIIHAPVAGGMCTSCHSPHSSDNGKLLISSQPDLCFNCHDKTDFTRKNVHAAVKTGCTTCHNPHADKERFLLEQGINGTCLKCHTDIDKQPHITAFDISFQAHPLRGKRVKTKEKIDGKTIERITFGKDPLRPDREFSCASCHNPHSSDSIRLFRYKADSAFALCGYCHKSM